MSRNPAEDPSAGHPSNYPKRVPQHKTLAKSNRSRAKQVQPFTQIATRNQKPLRGRGNG